jgi:hypothetical protein
LSFCDSWIESIDSRAPRSNPFGSHFGGLTPSRLGEVEASDQVGVNLVVAQCLEYGTTAPLVDLEHEIGHGSVVRIEPAIGAKQTNDTANQRLPEGCVGTVNNLQADIGPC